MKRVERNPSFGGWQEVWEHESAVLGCRMRFGIYLPPGSEEASLPALYFLSGLTCTEQNVITKSGFQRYAAEHRVIVITPDTSPRGEAVADDDAWDLGQGAGFYLNATQSPWKQHYQMYDYVRDELPALIEAHFQTNGRRSITGHSMGGHGALVLALKNPGMFKSVSAFAPICAPSKVPWGVKAFTAYLGDSPSTWEEWDAVALVPEATERLPLLIDQGEADGFLEEQLQPQHLAAVCKANGHPCIVRLQPNYDHSYFFIASFIGEHIRHHAKALYTDRAASPS